MTNTTTQTAKQTYNGWTNYATWRIALEWFSDGFNPNKYESDPYQLSKDMEQYVEETLEDMTNQNTLVLDYALSFISEVNWYEIAQHLIEEQNN